MKHRACRLIIGWSAFACSAPGASAPSGGPFAIVNSTIDSGGGPVSAGIHTVRSTIGQPDADTASGGAFALRGGFWGAPFSAAGDTIFDNGFD